MTLTDWLCLQEFSRILRSHGSALLATSRQPLAAVRWQDRNGRPLHAAIVFYGPLTDHLSSYSLECAKQVPFISIAIFFPTFFPLDSTFMAARKNPVACFIQNF